MADTGQQQKDDVSVNGQDAYHEVPEVITSEADLKKYLESTGNSSVDDDAIAGDGDAGDATSGDVVDIGDDTTDADADAESEGDSKFDNMVHYMNDRFKLNMNLDQIPTDLNRQKESEIIGDLYARTLQGVNQTIDKYQSIEKILEDKEVAEFIAAKANGKTMRDFASQYALSYDGMTNEGIVSQSLREQFPDLDEEDIRSQVDALKEKGTFDKVSAAARKKMKSDEDFHKSEITEKEKQTVLYAQQQREADIATYQQYVGSIDNVKGLPVNDKMRQTLFVAATQVDEKGLTYLDKALQSDEGVLRATLGIIYLDQLLGAKVSGNQNRQNKSLLDRLIDDPKKLQSSGGQVQPQEFSNEAANRF